MPSEPPVITTILSLKLAMSLNLHKCSSKLKMNHLDSFYDVEKKYTLLFG